MQAHSPPARGRAVILVDTSVWIDHLRSGDKALDQALTKGDVLMHPFVFGELACGTRTNDLSHVAIYRLIRSAMKMSL